MSRNSRLVHGFSPKQLTEQGINTSVYQRELLLEHRICQIRNKASVSVVYSQEESKWAVNCSDCMIYVAPEERL